MSDARKSTSHCSKCSSVYLEALYQSNVEAKRYAEAACDAYEQGLKGKARHYSLRKEGLYSFKRAILESLFEHGCVDSVRLHEIDSEEYYCFYVGGFSFHCPVEDWDDEPIENCSASSKKLEGFDSSADGRSDLLPEKAALDRLCEEFGSPNDHVPTPFVNYEYGPAFAGWPTLPGAVDEGDQVDGRFGRARDGDFLFVVGDAFDTGEGRCRIRDRYEAWLTPLWDRTPIRPTPVYDVELDGELREGVRQRRLVDDWWILADSLHDPLPDVDGKQGEMVGTASDDRFEFDVGDVVEVDPDWDDDGPYFHRIEEAHVSYTLLLCDLAPVGPTEHETNLAVEEFADDVVAVHDSPSTVE